MYDWRVTRKAIEGAYKKLGKEIPSNIPRDDWKFAEAILDEYQAQNCRTCGECSKPIDYRCEIICLDCKLPLHEDCAHRHFWPNGRASS